MTTSTYTAGGLLHAALTAFNRLPRQTLDVGTFPDTYALASAIEVFERKPAGDVAWELEVCLFGMRRDKGSDIAVFADTQWDIEFADVELQLRFEETGQVETLFERNDLPVERAMALFDVLTSLFPQASENVWPETATPTRKGD